MQVGALTNAEKQVIECPRCSASLTAAQVMRHAVLLGMASPAESLHDGTGALGVRSGHACSAAEVPSAAASSKIERLLLLLSELRQGRTCAASSQ